MNREVFADLAARGQAGDREAMEELLLQAHTPVSFLCRKLLQNRNAAAALTREILMLIRSRLDSLSDPQNCELWIRRVTAARCVKALEQLPRERPENQDLPETVQIPRQTLDEVQTAQTVQQMADHLPEQTRLCLLLYCCGGIEVGGIAQLTGLPESSVMENLNRAQDNINKQLRKFYKMGIRFAKVTSLPELLCTAMYQSADPASAAEAVNALLAPEAPAPVRSGKPQKDPVRVLLYAAAAAALLLLFLLALLLFQKL